MRAISQRRGGGGALSPTECVLGAPREGTAYICASRADATRENNYCFASWAFVDKDGADLSSAFSAVGSPAVDPSAAGAGGFACPVSAGGAAGSATVVWGAAVAGGVAALGFRSRVEICEKPSAASLAPAGQPAQASTNDGFAIFERATSMVAELVRNIIVSAWSRRLELECRVLEQSDRETESPRPLYILFGSVHEPAR